MIDIATAVLAIGAFLAALTFVVRFAPTGWRKTAAGQHVMAFMLVALILLSLAVLTSLFGTDWYGRPVVRLIAFALLNWVLWWRVMLLFRFQHEAHHPNGTTTTPRETP